MKKISNIHLKIIVSIYIALYTALIYFSPIKCFVLKLTGIRCLTCGMTRAWISAVKLDLKGAFIHHFMFWSIPILYICFLLDGKLFKSKKANAVFYTFIIIGFIINWIFHQFIW